MRVVFVHAGMEFDGSALAERALGGTETALIGVSRELARIAGNEIVVFTNTPRQAVFDGVAYRPLAGLKQWSAQHRIDVLVSIRQWMPFWLNLEARLRIYFSPDAYDQPFLRRAFEVTIPIDGQPTLVPIFEPKHFMKSVDLIFCVGRWQAQTFTEKLGFPPDKIVVTGNAIFPENFRPRPYEAREPGLVYSATPFRGLHHLARYFPEIQGSVDTARLIVCSSMTVYGVAAAEDEQQFGSVYRALAEQGAECHGSVPQHELSEIMCRNLVYAYPNTFAETFCISVLEAQAAGLAVVTSNRAGLAERITHGVDGFLVDGEPGDATYRRTFIETVVMLLTHPDEWRRISGNAIRTAQGQTYARLAAAWHERFTAELGARADAPRRPLEVPDDIVIAHPRDAAKNTLITPVMLANLIRVGTARYGG